MSIQLSTTSIIGTIILAALLMPLFALACTRSGGDSEPSAFINLNAAFARFGR